MQKHTSSCIQLLLLSTTLLLSLVSGQTVYIQSNSACGDMCDGSMANPWPTLSRGIEATFPVGGEIIINPGTYMGPGNVDLRIANSGPIIIRSSSGNAADVIFDGQRMYQGLLIEDTGAVNMEGITLRNFNTAGRCGGAITLRGVNATFIRTDFLFNQVTVGGDGGGAVCVTSASLNISESRVIQNQAINGRGGGFAFNNAWMMLNNIQFGENQAGMGGDDVSCLSSEVRLIGTTDLGDAAADGCRFVTVVSQLASL